MAAWKERQVLDGTVFSGWDPFAEPRGFWFVFMAACLGLLNLISHTVPFLSDWHNLLLVVVGILSFEVARLHLRQMDNTATNSCRRLLKITTAASA